MSVWMNLHDFFESHTMNLAFWKRFNFATYNFAFYFHAQHSIEYTVARFILFAYLFKIRSRNFLILFILKQLIQFIKLCLLSHTCFVIVVFSIHNHRSIEVAVLKRYDGIYLLRSIREQSFFLNLCHEKFMLICKMKLNEAILFVMFLRFLMLFFFFSLHIMQCSEIKWLFSLPFLSNQSISTF